jgi:hypothetical protein
MPVCDVLCSYLVLMSNVRSLLIRVPVHYALYSLPDGFKRRRRGNTVNADLNRDYPDQFRHPGMPDNFERRQPEVGSDT